MLLALKHPFDDEPTFDLTRGFDDDPTVVDLCYPLEDDEIEDRSERIDTTRWLPVVRR